MVLGSKFLIITSTMILSVRCFSPSPSLNQVYSSSCLFETSSSKEGTSVEWDLFKMHHAPGSWKGVWSSYSVDGDIVDETIASIDYDLNQSDDSIQQTHLITVGASRADCQTWMRTKTSFETKSFPVAVYSKNNMRKLRLVSVSMVNGPTFLRSGVMSTELVLSHGDGRIRAIFQHAPHWSDNINPSSATPPDDFEIFRVIVSREALRSSPPTSETEAKDPPSEGNPVFFRPVPSERWHKIWGGKSFTWDTYMGHETDIIAEIKKDDAWHENPQKCDASIWSLRLPGGILLQGPRKIGAGEKSVCRLAWIPVDDVLLRVEAAISALVDPEQSGTVTLAKSPLHQIQCDVFDKIGDDLSNFIENEEEFIRPNEVADIPKNSDNDDGFERVRNSLIL